MRAGERIKSADEQERIKNYRDALGALTKITQMLGVLSIEDVYAKIKILLSNHPVGTTKKPLEQRAGNPRDNTNNQMKPSAPPVAELPPSTVESQQPDKCGECGKELATMLVCIDCDHRESQQDWRGLAQDAIDHVPDGIQKNRLVAKLVEVELAESGSQVRY